MSGDPSNLTLDKTTGGANDRVIPLEAVRASPQRIVIQGNGDDHLGRDSGPHNFSFSLADRTNTNVRFKPITSKSDPRPMLWAQDECSTCPPPPDSLSNQIDKVERESDTQASFRDKNDNRKADILV